MNSHELKKEVDELLSNQEKDNLKAVVIQATQRINKLYRTERKAAELRQTIEKTREELFQAYDEGKLLETERLTSRIVALAVKEI